MSMRFFKPYNPDKYAQGLLNNVKVLVLGASHYCTYNEKSDKFKCRVWQECTSNESKDSSKFNDTCPYLERIGNSIKLEDTTCDEIENYLSGCDYPSYENFTQLMIDYTSLNKNEIWERIAFTNYVQYLVPRVVTPTQTKSDIKNFESFLETLDELKPDLVIIWGTKITDHFQKKYIKKLVNILKVRDNSYFFDLLYNGRHYILINPYHPCNYRNSWSKNQEQFKIALESAFKEISKNH